MSARPRAVASAYNAAGRLWLLAAALALLLPAADRLGWWLPLHLALTGSASVTISGNLQTFASALSAGPAPPSWMVWTQLAAVNLGAALIAAGYSTNHPGIVAAGGTTFLASMLLLGASAWRSWRRGLNRRHRLPAALYGIALLAILAGGTLGALLGSGAIHDGVAWLALRRAHMTVNLLGWVSLVIVGTLVTFLPTVLRVRMPRWHGGLTVVLLAAGAGLLAGGFALRQERVAAGGTLYAAGSVAVAWMAVRVIRVPRRWPIPVAAKHLLPALAWFVCGSVALAVAAVRGSEAFDGFLPVFVVAFALGWIVQVLLGAWLYLIPMAAGGGPSDRRRYLTAVDWGGTPQALVFNAGLALVALRAAASVPASLGRLGLGMALTGGGVAFAKSWAFSRISRLPVVERKAREAWGL